MNLPSVRPLSDVRRAWLQNKTTSACTLLCLHVVTAWYNLNVRKSACAFCVRVSVCVSVSRVCE